MKVCVTQLDGINTMHALPLAAGQLVATARLDPVLREQARFEIVVDRDAPAEIAASLEPPDVLGLSLYLWNQRVSLELARLVRGAHPQCLIVVGGPAVPRRPDAASAFLEAHPQVDVLVRGEGEPAFTELLRAHLEGRPLDDIAGLALRRSGRAALVTPARPRLHDLSETGSPYLDGTFDALCAKHSDRFPGWHATALLETNRGCPFRCTFCMAGLVEQNRVYELPLERIRHELDWVAAQRFNYVFIADANFGIRPRDPEIVEHLVALKLRTGYPGYCFFYMTKNAQERNLATVERLREAGMGCQVALSTQSFDTSVLSAVKRANIPAKRWTRLRDICDERGIPTYNELILGLPEQSLASVTSSLVQAISPLAEDIFYLYLCRVIPNTDMDEPDYRARYGVETRHCVARPPDPHVVYHLDEIEEIVVGTSALPVPDWRRAYTLGYFVSAVYNQRLLDAVVYYLQVALEADLGAWFHDLVDGLAEAVPDSVLGAIGAVFERYTASILSGGPVLLPVEGAGAASREVGDGVVRVVLERPDAFLDEVRARTEVFLASEGHTPGAELDEVFRFQRLQMPTFGEEGGREAHFERDWLDWWLRRRGQPTPAPRATRLRYSPPAYARLALFDRFIDAHLASLRARAAIGQLAAVAAAPEHAERAVSGTP